MWLLCQDADQTNEAVHDLIEAMTEQLDKEMLERMGKDG
jgi:hypothetical protein